jgi:hypothetical protein
MPTKPRAPDASRLDRIVAEARRHQEARARTYREQALKLFPWICGRCAREFDRSNVRELTVHHKDHNHDNNPPDGSNWSCCASIATTTSIRASSRLLPAPGPSIVTMQVPQRIGRSPTSQNFSTSVDRAMADCVRARPRSLGTLSGGAAPGA